MAAAFAVFSGIALVLGFYLDVGNLRSELTHSRPPVADIVFFEKNNGDYKLLDPTNIELDPTSDEMSKNYFAVPINVAVRNQESVPLEATRVEISYPKDVEVKPGGKPKIDPANRVLIYEHDLEDLQAVDNYTPLETVDTLYFPFSFEYSSSIIVGPDLSTVSVIMGIQQARYLTVELGIRVYSKGRPALNGKIRLKIGDRAGDPGPTQDIKEEKPTKNESRLFHDVASRVGTAPNKWVARDLSKSHLLKYRKTRYQGGAFGVLLIDQKVRWITADLDDNGFVDITLGDTTTPGSPDIKTTPLGPEPMIDTPKPNGQGSVD